MNALIVCESCGSPRIHTYPASRRSGRVIIRCRSCSLRFLSNPEAAHVISDFYDSFDRDLFTIYADAKRSTLLDSTWRSTLDRIATVLGAARGRSLFDVGAGDGQFLQLAHSDGFEVAGNELAPGAVEMAKEAYGIDLHLGELSTIEGSDHFDAVTMWCVLAHVSDPRALLADCLRILKPGGVLFMQTPRWSAMDATALAASRVTRGRMSRVVDRRLSDTHMRLHSKRSMREALRALGFETITTDSRVRYSFETIHYLASLGVPERAQKSVSSSFDWFLNRDLFFRNVLDVYARKPAT